MFWPIVIKYIGHAMWFGRFWDQHLWQLNRLERKTINATYLLFMYILRNQNSINNIAWAMVGACSDQKFECNLKNFANSWPSVSNFKSFFRSLDQFLLTAGQNNLGNKILFLWSIIVMYLQFARHFFSYCFNHKLTFVIKVYLSRGPIQFVITFAGTWKS